MRTLLILSFAILIAPKTFSQRTPEMIIAGIPNPPSEACSMTSDEKSNYSKKVENLQDLLDEEIQARKEEYKKEMGNNTEKIQQNMGNEMGLSAAEMAKLQKGGKMSDAQAMELANKMMGQKYNMSVGEAKKLGKMSKEGQKAYAEGYGAEMMADAQANPDKYLADQKKNKNMYELTAEQSKLAHQIQAESEKFRIKLQEINSKDSVEKIKLEKQLAPLKIELDKINDGEGSTKADAARAYGLLTKIYALEITYCEIMTPLYLNFLNQRLISLKANLPLNYRMEEITNQLTEAQTGVKVKIQSPNLMAMQSITEYMRNLKDVFRFTPPMEKPTLN